MHSQSHWTGMEDRTDLRHKLATQVKESTKMVNHSTQTFEDPFEKNSYFHWMEIDSQKVEVPKDFINELTLDMLRPAAAKHLPVSDAREYKTSEEHHTTPDYPRRHPRQSRMTFPRYLLVDKDLCWRWDTLVTSDNPVANLEDILLPLWTMWSSFSGLFL
ncbi:hypothetical protein JTB14_003095 [Gonioctena quinquepunctata]|nr:hypothetical protein JTB14_003095 [Gonioctena quinquepunctata]